MYQRWRKENRYFTTHLAEDLFGDWVLTRCWGDLDSGRSQTRRDCFASREQAVARLREICRRQSARGYRILKADT